MNKNDNPGVYIPPPLIYAAFFFLSILLQKLMALDKDFFSTRAMYISGWILIAFFAICAFPALFKFFQTKTTMVTILPAKKLATTGIYSFTRNPMYLGLLFLYSGLAALVGNWWTFILIPVLIFVVQAYVIRREEAYLSRAFGEEYEQYKRKVRRWI